MSRLTRRTPLPPGKPLARGESQLRRSRIRPISDKRADAAPIRQTVAAEVFRRDPFCLLASDRAIPPCFGIRTPHHLRKASQGGRWTVDNIVALCEFHNGWIEDDGMDYGRDVGLVCLRTDTLEACWARLYEVGLVTYNPQGEPL